MKYSIACLSFLAGSFVTASLCAAWNHSDQVLIVCILVSLILGICVAVQLHDMET